MKQPSVEVAATQPLASGSPAWMRSGSGGVLE